MSNEEKTTSGVKRTILRIPSLISSNRTVIAVLAFLFLLPLGTGASTSPLRALISLISQIMIFSLLAISFDLQLGRSALLNFGHVALFGVGAYFMAYTLDADLFPPPFNLIAAVPYPLTIVLAMLVGGGLGFIMGLTTSRMRGTAFAFIALAISMFLYNFFAENPDISGGETGLRVSTPDLIRTGPFYLLFVALAFVFLATLIGMIILYIRKRIEYTGLILVSTVMVTLTGILFVLGTNIVGPVLVFLSFLGVIFLYWMERKSTVSDPLQYSEMEMGVTDPLTAYALPFSIIMVALLGFVISFATNINDMLMLWIEDSQVFLYTIPVTYYLVLSCLAITYLFVKRLIASPFGRMVTAVAQNEERAEALGYNSYSAKIVVLVISGAIAGLAGALYAPYLRVIDPHSVLGVEITINAMLYTIIGGIGTLFGPILGTGVVVYSELNLVDFMTEGLGLPGQLWLVGLGIMYIFIVLFMPLGIVGSIGRRASSLKAGLRRIKLGRFEFGFKDSDYWAFALLGVMGVIFFLIEDSRFFLVSLGIFGILGFILLILLWTFRSDIVSRVRSSFRKSRFSRGGN
jgi:ABC-type branched-subunit amino acid transport system permease subunit